MEGDLAAGCILRRPCFCTLAGTREAALFPVHTCWPLIRLRVAPWDPLFSSVKGRNFNRTPRAVMSKIRGPSAERFISQAFRRGASQELKESGSHRSVSASMGVWHPTAFRGYVDMSRDVELVAQQLFDVDVGPETDSDVMVRFWVSWMMETH